MSSSHTEGTPVAIAEDNDDMSIIESLNAERSSTAAMEDDTRSEAEMSEFSAVGISTPGSWTDVDTESEGEAVNGSSFERRQH